VRYRSQVLVEMKLTSLQMWLSGRHEQEITKLCEQRENLLAPIASWLMQSLGYNLLAAAFQCPCSDSRAAAFKSVDVLRRAVQFLDWETKALQNEQKRVKQKRRHVLFHLIKIEAVKVTVECAIADQSLASSVFLKGSADWKLLDSMRDDLLEGFYRRGEGPLDCGVRFDFEAVVSSKRRKTRFPNETFVVPSSLVPSVMVGLARHLLLVKGSYRICSVSLDVFPELLDFRLAASGAGKSFSRVWWRDAGAEDGVTLERYAFLDETGEIEREVEWFEDLSSLCDDVVEGTSNGLVNHMVCRSGGVPFFFFKKKYTQQVERRLVPVAGHSFKRQVFVDNVECVRVAVAVDSCMSFFALSRTWQADQLNRCKNVQLFPHSVVTVHVLLDDDIPSCLKKVLKLPELEPHFNPCFSSMLACVAFCYGGQDTYLVDHKQSKLTALSVLKERRRQKAEDGQDPKLFWSVERTLHSWLGGAVFLALSAQTLRNSSRLGGIFLSGAAIVIALYAVGRWSWRNFSIKKGGPTRAFADRIAPVAIACLILMFLFLAVLN
jgi:hypothetical protein